MYERREAAWKAWQEKENVLLAEEELKTVRAAFEAGWHARKELDYKPMTDIA